MSEDSKTAELIGRAHHDRHVDKRQKWILFWLCGITAIVALIGISLWMQARGEAEASAEVAATEQQQKVEVAEEARQALCGDADQEIYDRELCEKWAGIADEAPVDVTAEPPLVIGGPSRADLVQAFGEYCAQGNCQGRDGAEPTPDEVAAAFARFCADGRCTGPAGADGSDGAPGADAPQPRDGVDGQNGEDGQDGAAAPPPSLELMAAAVTEYCATGACVGPEGPSGPAPTTEAIAAAVAAYCSSGICVGPAGPPGADGADGADGEDGTDAAPTVSIADTICVGEGSASSWQITYTDGRVQDAGGPCKPDPAGIIPTTPPIIDNPGAPPMEGGQ